MKKSIKTSLIVIALVFVACLAGLWWLSSRPAELDETLGPAVSDTSLGPSFEVRVIMPRAGLPLGGILPDALVKKLDGTPRELRFDHASSGARIVSVAADRLELSADGWNLLIETDAQGQIAPATHLVFPIGLGGRDVSLNCRPADRPNGYLRTATRAGSGGIAGRFVVELTNCKNAESGKTVEWPPAALTVRGNVVGPPPAPGPSQAPAPK